MFFSSTYLLYLLKSIISTLKPLLRLKFLLNGGVIYDLNYFRFCYHLKRLDFGNWCLHYATATGYQHLVSVLISSVWALFISRLLIEFRCCALADACLAEISRPSDTSFRSWDLESYSNRKHTAGALRKGIREIIE